MPGTGGDGSQFTKSQSGPAPWPLGPATIPILTEASTVERVLLEGRGKLIQCRENLSAAFKESAIQGSKGTSEKKGDL